MAPTAPASNRVRALALAGVAMALVAAVWSVMKPDEATPQRGATAAGGIVKDIGSASSVAGGDVTRLVDQAPAAPPALAPDAVDDPARAPAPPPASAAAVAPDRAESIATSAVPPVGEATTPPESAPVAPARPAERAARPERAERPADRPARTAERTSSERMSERQSDAARARPAREPSPPRAPAASSAPSTAAIATGELRFAVSPWGEIEIDGVSRGTTPPMNMITLPEGSHRVTIRNADFPPFSTTIQVGPGAPTVIRHRFGS